MNNPKVVAVNGNVLAKGIPVCVFQQPMSTLPAWLAEGEALTHHLYMEQSNTQLALDFTEAAFKLQEVFAEDVVSACGTTCRERGLMTVCAVNFFTLYQFAACMVETVETIDRAREEP